MTKRKKILLIVLPIVALFLILFTPIPKTETLSEGSALTLNSLTYKVVVWDTFNVSQKPYNKTEFFLLPNNFTNTQLIWEEKENDLRKQGYGAISIIVSVEKIENNRIWIKELTNDKNAINNVVIDFNDIEKYGKDITTNDIKENTLLKISCDGMVLESYPSLLGRIYSIKLVAAKTNETIISNSPTDDNTGSEVQVESSSQETTTSNAPTSSNTESIQSQSSVPDNSSSVETSTTTSQEDDVFVPLFWDQTMHNFDDHYDDVSNIHIPYRVIEPYNYDPNQKYPVILFLHGAGYRFNTSDDVDFNKLQVSTLASSFIFNYEWLNKAIIIAPQISKNDWWDFGQNSNGSLDAAMRIFEKVTSEYSCDSSRYYVTGGSMGGYATWQVAVKYKDVFAAAMPMCGWWTPSDATRLVDMPIRIIHGTADSTVSVERSKLMYNAIKDAGGQKVVLSLYEGAEHDVWRQAYLDAETWEWLFSQKKE